MAIIKHEEKTRIKHEDQDKIMGLAKTICPDHEFILISTQIIQHGKEHAMTPPQIVSTLPMSIQDEVLTTTLKAIKNDDYGLTKSQIEVSDMGHSKTTGEGGTA